MEKIFENFDFQMKSEIIFGKDAEMRAGEMVKKYGGTKAMIVMDGGGFIKSSGLFGRVAASLDEAGIPYVELEGVQPNPRRTLVETGLDICAREGVDFLLPIGGGSTIDTAKAIALGLVYGKDGYWKFFNGEVPETMAPVGAISTIAATGSETSGSAVIYDDIEDMTKKGNMFMHIRTSFAILNPELTYTVPTYQTGCGTADIFCHAFDTYLCYATSTLGDSLAEAVMRTVIQFGPVALKNPTDYEARAELFMCAQYAHDDICRVGRGPQFAGVHMLETHMTAYFDTAHGAGLSVLMPAFLTWLLENDETTVEKIAKLAVNVFDVKDGADKKAVGYEGVARLSAWLAELGMPKTITELAKREITDEDITDLVEHVPLLPDGNAMCFGHVKQDGLREIFTSVRG